MAGGQGTRLHPLTRDRAKPAVPFGGKYRIIDFVLSNLINSGIYAIYVLVQWRSQSLIEHLKDGWQFGGMLPDHFVIPVPAQMRMGETWYQGTADAIFQNLNLIDDTKPDLVAVFGADHIYRMDIQQMIEFHMDRKAAVTVATLPVPVEPRPGEVVNLNGECGWRRILSSMSLVVVIFRTLYRGISGARGRMGGHRPRDARVSCERVTSRAPTDGVAAGLWWSIA